MNASEGSISWLTSHNSFKVFLLFGGVAGVVAAIFLANTLALVTLSALTIVCSFWLMQKATGILNLRALTIPGTFYLLYLVEILIPSFLVYAEQRDPYRQTFLFAVESALLTVPLGILFAKRIFRFQQRETTAFFTSPQQDSSSDPGPEVYVLFLMVALGITCLYVLEVRTIPLFYMLRHPGETDYLVWLREKSLKLLDSPLRYAYATLPKSLYPLLIAFSFGRYLLTRQRSWAVLFLASLLPGVLFAGFTIAKGPVAALFLILCLYFYLYRSGKVGGKFVLLCVASILGYPLFVQMQVYAGSKGSDLLSQLQAIGERMFYLPAEVLYYYFRVFPHVVPYQHGRTIGKFAMLLGEKTFDSPNTVGRYMRPYGLYTINANAAFLGDLNADFGIAGILTGGFLAGVIMEVAQIYLVRRGKSALTLSIYANFIEAFHELNSASLPSILLSQGPAFILVVAWTMVTLDSMILSALRIDRGGRPVKGWRWVSRRGLGFSRRE